MTRHKWRRTDLNGEIATDDWILLHCPRSPLTQKPGDNSRDQGAANRSR